MPDEATRRTVLPHTYRHGGVQSARTLNRAGQLLSNISVHNGLEGYVTRRGITLYGDQFPWHRFSFGSKMKDSSTVTVYAGRIIVYGKGVYVVSETDVSLTGNTEWVWAYHALDHSSSGIDHGAAEPNYADSTFAYLPLMELASSDGGATYTITFRHHIGVWTLGGMLV